VGRRRRLQGQGQGLEQESERLVGYTDHDLRQREQSELGQAQEYDDHQIFDSVDDLTPAINQPSRRLYTPLPCPKFGGVIIHHASAGEGLLEERLVAHLCEYTLFVDKVKSDSRMKALWSSVSRLTHPVYHDFSPVLTREGELGWSVVLKNIEDRQQACRNGTSGSSGGGDNGTVAVDDAACQAWRRRQLRSAGGNKAPFDESLESLEPTQGGGLMEVVGVRDYLGGWMAAYGL
jgi:hypothetical protein